MLPYDTDIRVPFYVRGPRIQPNSTVDIVSGNVDLAPSILGLAGVPIPAFMDGKSFASVIVRQSDELPSETAQPWRTAFLAQINVPGFSYFGTNRIYFRSDESPLHGVIRHPPMARADNASAKFIYNDPTNAWRMLRIINATHNLAYIEFGSFWGPSPPGPR